MTITAPSRPPQPPVPTRDIQHSTSGLSTLTSHLPSPTSNLQPLTSILHSFSRASLIGGILIAALTGLQARTGYGPVADLLVFGALGFLLVWLFEGLAVLLWKLLDLLLRLARAARPRAGLRAFRPEWLGRPLGAAFLVLADALFPDSFLKVINLSPAAEMWLPALALTGPLLALARRPALAGAAESGWRRWLRPYAHPRGAALLGAAGLLHALTLGYIFWPGTDDYVARAELSPAVGVAPLALPDPAEQGPYAVQTLTYGSGADRRRFEFGAGADLLTPVLDGTPLFAGYTGPAGWYFRTYWGFDFTQLPLNGRVWYPTGAGPFPLVLAVHGNHGMSDFSDPGYAYLGEHLASRGYIFVSVDQNFLNGFWLEDGQFRELSQRAWLLLEHLRQWRAWNTDPASPFYQRVDLERVGLIGHSRGGEAVAYAAELNRHVTSPVTQVAQTDDYNFGIRGVVAIAPSDGHAKPGGSSPALRHTDYLLLIGGHDADTYLNYGIAQYNRVRFGENPGGFRALAYLYRANHGQFNTVWGANDQNLLNSLLLNRRPLLSGDEQRQAARVFITAFLEASLNDQAAYRAVFYNPAAAQGWLPADLFVTGYQDESFRMLAGLDQKPGRDALDVAGGSVEATGVSAWNRVLLQLRDGQTLQGNAAARLEWAAGAAPAYSLRLPPGQAAAWALSPADSLSFALGPAGQQPLPLAVRVTIETASGAAVTLPLEQFGALHPPLPARQLKGQWFAWMLSMKYDVAWPAEYVLQTYDLPLAAFQAAGPAFQPADIALIRLAFDGPEGGAVYVDQVGFRQSP